MLACTALHGCQSGEPEAARVTDSGRATTVEQVRATPERFLGQRVRVTGTIDAILSDHAFELEGTDWAFGDNIVVLMRREIPLAWRTFGRDDELIVTGTVRRFIDTADDIERELRVSFSPELEVSLKAHSLLIADSIRKIRDDDGK